MHMMAAQRDARPQPNRVYLATPPAAAAQGIAATATCAATSKCPSSKRLSRCWPERRTRSVRAAGSPSTSGSGCSAPAPLELLQRPVRLLRLGAAGPAHPTAPGRDVPGRLDVVRHHRRPSLACLVRLDADGLSSTRPSRDFDSLGPVGAVRAGAQLHVPQRAELSTDRGAPAWATLCRVSRAR